MKNAREISIIEVFNSKYQNIYLSGKNCEDIQFVMWKEVSLGRKRVDRSYQILSGTKFCPSSYSMTFTLICKTNTTAAGNTSWPNIKKTGKKKKAGLYYLYTFIFVEEKKFQKCFLLQIFLPVPPTGIVSLCTCPGCKGSWERMSQGCSGSRETGSGTEDQPCSSVEGANAVGHDICLRGLTYFKPSIITMFCWFIIYEAFSSKPPQSLKISMSNVNIIPNSIFMHEQSWYCNR